MSSPVNKNIESSAMLLRPRRKTKQRITLLILAMLLVLLSMVCLSIGSSSIPLREVIAALLGRAAESAQLIVVQFRLPRVLAALCVGAALAVSGVLLQGIVRNPLASPELIGVTGGASVAAVAFLTMSAGSLSIHWLPLISIAGAFVATALNYVLTWKQGISPYRLVLIGIGLSTALAAMTTFLLISGPAHLASQVLNWMTGSIYGTGWKQMLALGPWIGLFLPFTLIYASALNVQSLGDSVAIGLGSRLQRDRLVMLLCCVALAGAAVGMAGMLSFIGLLAPHMARKLVGSAHGFVLPTAALLGAIILLLADLAGRMLFAPIDVPAGVFTAGVGAPYFLYLLYRSK
ncbi:iron ABC transporter permease [Paenibacillus sp. YYML68]|uniref:FecCD family ABC transporter permease n=1 Tax=Paenibacillus sp. YYML68 TaxID=2909250 RepID=UPI002490414B|nr:iron ABC transporter permease [Paenibacillus sp. YYML68]